MIITHRGFYLKIISILTIKYNIIVLSICLLRLLYIIIYYIRLHIFSQIYILFDCQKINDEVIKSLDLRAELRQVTNHWSCLIVL